MDTIKFAYDFNFPDGSAKSYTVELDSQTLSIIPNQKEVPPDWTKLENNKCIHCPLDAKTTPHCPVSANLSHLVEYFSDKVSYEEVSVKVTTKQRTYSQKLSLQDAVFSIFGLIMATSPCPYMDILKPMAKFHLPFATSEETMVRSISMYLLRQYFVAKRGGSQDMILQKLESHYNDIQEVNHGILKRIRGLASGDADANAIIILHSFSALLTSALNHDLTQIEALFNKKSS